MGGGYIEGLFEEEFILGEGKVSRDFFWGLGGGCVEYIRMNVF